MGSCRGARPRWCGAWLGRPGWLLPWVGSHGGRGLAGVVVAQSEWVEGSGLVDGLGEERRSPVAHSLG